MHTAQRLDLPVKRIFAGGQRLQPLPDFRQCFLIESTARLPDMNQIALFVVKSKND